MKRKKLFTLVVAVMLIMSLTVTGCGNRDNNVVVPNGDTEWTGETFHWRMQGYTAVGTTFYEYGLHLAQLIERMSGGRITIDFFGVGEIVAGFEMPNAIRDGILDVIFCHGGQWTSVEPGMALFSSTPGMFSDPFDALHWVEHGGGLEIWRELVRNHANGRVIVSGVLDNENFLWANERVTSIEQLQRMHIRMMPLGGDILAANGVSVVFLPGGEVVPAIERGVIDGGEFATSALDYTFGFHDVARYRHLPGWHQPSAMLKMVISYDAWNALPDDLQAIVEAAARYNTMWTWMQNSIRNQEANVRFLENGNELVVMPPEMVATLHEWAEAFFDEAMRTDPVIRRIKESQRAFVQWWAPYKTDQMMPFPDWAFDRAAEQPFRIGE